MYTSTATVPTDRAARYRDQLASHGAQLARKEPGSDGHLPPQIEADVADETLVLSLAWGRCTIVATAVALELNAEAETLDDLAKIQDGVGGRIAKIGRRDGLTVAWSGIDGPPGSISVGRRGSGHGALSIVSMIRQHLRGAS